VTRQISNFRGLKRYFEVYLPLMPNVKVIEMVPRVKIGYKLSVKGQF
jgi:hypothetical protein